MPGQNFVADVATTFVRPCLDCGSTVHVIDTVEQSHTCVPEAEPTDATRALVAKAWWAGFETGRAAAG